MRWMGWLLYLLPLIGQAGTVYLCQSYDGRLFWTNTHCNRQRALVQRMKTVPDDLSFQQQVELAEQDRADGMRIARNMADSGEGSVVGQAHGPGQWAQMECASIKQRIVELDRQARQPWEGDKQDRIAAERRVLRNRQFQLKCQ